MRKGRWIGNKKKPDWLTNLRIAASIPPVFFEAGGEMWDHHHRPKQLQHLSFPLLPSRHVLHSRRTTLIIIIYPNSQTYHPLHTNIPSYHWESRKTHIHLIRKPTVFEQESGTNQRKQHFCCFVWHQNWLTTSCLTCDIWDVWSHECILISHVSPISNFFIKFYLISNYCKTISTTMQNHS